MGRVLLGENDCERQPSSVSNMTCSPPTTSKEQGQGSVSHGYDGDVVLLTVYSEKLALMSEAPWK